MRRAAVCLVLATGFLFAVPASLVAGAADVQAQDKDDKKKDEERKRRKREKQVAELKAIGADFAAKNVTGLLDRVAKGAKISLDVGKGDEGQYSADQAKGVLRQYFDDFDEITVSFSKADDTVGSFKMTVRKKGEDKAKPRTLQVTIDGPDANGTITLTKLAVSR